jgi:hypothetical protein
MNGNGISISLKCPVCGARFRGTPECSRCGTNLDALMRLAAGAWVVRQRARAALLQGDLDGTLSLSRAAQRLQRTPMVRR